VKAKVKAEFEVKVKAHQPTEAGDQGPRTKDQGPRTKDKMTGLSNSTSTFPSSLTLTFASTFTFTSPL
jgi:hypothetical protein